MRHRQNVLPSFLPAAFALSAMLCADCLQLSAAENERSQTGQPVLVESKRIWDQAPHNAFTDLLRFKDRWYCVFREGKAHVSPDGSLRVITSADGAKWTSLALIESSRYDLRDAKITVMPDGRLMLNGAGIRVQENHPWLIVT